jgi:transcriptional regulator with XRE-family HTH domain
MTLKEVMKNIRKMRALTATTMAIMLGITPSYLSQIENKGNIPAWFVEKMTDIFKLGQDEILKLQSALQEAYKSADDNESLKRRIKKLIQECVAKLYAFVSNIFSGDIQATRESYNEIKKILNEIEQYVEQKETPLFN